MVAFIIVAVVVEQFIQQMSPVFWPGYIYIYGERGGGERQRQTDRETERDRDTQTERDRQTHRETDRQTDRETETERQIQRQRQTDRQTEIFKE